MDPSAPPPAYSEAMKQPPGPPAMYSTQAPYGAPPGGAAYPPQHGGQYPPPPPPTQYGSPYPQTQYSSPYPQTQYSSPQQYGQPVITPPTGYTANAGNTVVVVGAGCQTCQAGTYVEEFTACGIILAILFFPWGILCCLLMRERRCPRCNRLM
ncbi:uncharacterized protein LOC141907630 [Tubulanus polymorphus]|uniref:uncharacterized protein LOC141907630 n=1 Tax=Tubulanus polymorphus TaxID=672921 RepID=UPI003DA4ACE5